MLLAVFISFITEDKPFDNRDSLSNSIHDLRQDLVSNIVRAWCIPVIIILSQSVPPWLPFPFMKVHSALVTLRSWNLAAK